MDWYRSVLEVHKYLPATDILVSASTVHSVWTRASASFELWSLLCESLDSPCLDLPPKSAYRAHSFASVRLPLLTEHTLQFFNCARDRWESAIPLSQPLLVDQSSSVVTQTDGSVFVCGGRERPIPGKENCFRYTNDTFWIHGNGTVATLQPMLSHRGHHALAVVKGALYVFGGKAQILDGVSIQLFSCEKLRLPCGRDSKPQYWESLPNTSQLVSGCNPCTYQLQVYLYNYSSPGTVCVFDTVTNTFAEWAHFLGSQPKMESCLFFHNGELIVLRTLAIDFFSWEQKQGRLHRSNRLGGVLAKGAASPLVTASKVYIADYVAKVVFCFVVKELKVTKSYVSHSTEK